jgi:signal transduction histidine kinase
VVSLSAAPLPAGKGEAEGLVVRIRDVTEEQEMERLQQELITGFSHELRTPLAYISTVAEMMLAEEAGANSSRRREYLNILVAQSKRLAGFADRLLDVSRLESGSWVLQPRPVPIDLVVENALRLWRSDARHHSLSLQKPDQPVWVWADEVALETVLNSLIDNAMKYARHDLPITVSIQPDSNRFVQVAVEDAGPGISPQHQERVFDRFYRVHAADDQDVYGYGLGLWIAKELIEAMGGRIWVTSEVDRYCRFTFTVPQMLGETDE